MNSLRTRWRGLLATLMATATVGGLGAAVVASAPAAHAAFPGTNGPIVFVTGAGDLVKVDPTTAIQTTICSACAETFVRPAVSPNGQTVAFTQPASETLGLISVNGGSITTVSGSVLGDFQPTFTPDGSTLVFINGGGGLDGSLFKISATGAGGRTSLFGSPNDVIMPEVSPDGSTVAFRRDTGDVPLFTIPINGGAVTQLSVELLGSGGRPNASWSPDGSKIATVGAIACGATPIAVFSATGSNQAPTCLPSSTGGDVGPSWSPDGTKIAVVNGGGKPVLLNANGTPGRSVLGGAPDGNTYWAVASSSITTTTGPTTTTTTACTGTISGTAYKGSSAKPKKALAGVTVTAAPTPSGTSLTGTTNAAGAYSFRVPCGTYNKTATGPARSSRSCHFGSGKGPLATVATVTNGSTDVENLFCKGR